MKNYILHTRLLVIALAVFGMGLSGTTAWGQTTNQNYVRSTTYKVATQTSVPQPNDSVAQRQVTYFDGLGRPIQKIEGRMGGNGKDRITHIEYDAYGRPQYEYLPYVSEQSSDLSYQPNAKSETEGFSLYQGEAVYSRKFYEPSPLNRVLKQSAPGNAWVGNENNNNDRTIKFDYQTNGDEEVRKFSVTLSYNATDKVYEATLRDEGFYAKSVLYKTVTKDENWTTQSGTNHTTEEFKNAAGQVVLKRTYNQYAPHDTYYIYDDFGNLTFVLPPKINTQNGVSVAQLDALGYQYYYDDRNRMVAKKLPGKTWEFMVYDRLDRVVATGPAFNPFGGEQVGWMHTKYDAFGRVAYTLWKMESRAFDLSTRAQIQQTFDVSAAVHETRSGSNVDGYANPYSSAVFPQSDYKLLTVTFYDHYQFPGAPAQVPHDVQGQRVWANAKGLQTGSWVRVLAEPNETVGETTYTLYDYQGRALQTHTQNYLGGHTTVTQVYNFAGQVVNTQTNHQLFNGTNPIKVDENFTYTRQGQLKTRTHQINNQARELIADHHYDALGQLIRKEVGGQDFSTLQGLQSVDYRYNIRGWLTDINNVGTLAQSGRPHDLFAFKINYNQVEDNTTNGVVPLYNGNISETYWRSYNDNVLRNYGYTYDALNRLEEAFYQKPGYTQPNVNNYREKLTYDPNGNITHLWRNGELDATNFALEIDDLTYTYAPDSNLLLKVTDATAHAGGFHDDSPDGTLASDPSDDYAYDALGNMVKDENKTIRSIKYNHLNLPTFIDFGTRGTISYLYDATGRKVRKVVQNDVLSQNTVTDYANGFQYLDNVIQHFPTAEGYVSRLNLRQENGVVALLPSTELP
ncbi:DUF6443 domain-containing protein, partial [Flavobacterium sp.]|uniref:DUF6443 domain-containing protein n=2 Tax=Flavobacterium sp. TaxID=239 RepID=UPI0022CB2456